MAGHIELGKPEPLPSVCTASRRCQVLFHGPFGSVRASDPLAAILRTLWECHGDDDPRLRLFCRECSGGRKRAHLGAVFDTPAGGLLEVEMVAPPRVVPANPLPISIARQLPGWHRRGEPNAPQRLALLSDGFSDFDTLPGLYCPDGHGLRVAQYGDVRAAYDGGERNLGL